MRLLTVSVRACCCLWRAVLFPVARPSWASSSWITPVCLFTKSCRVPFSSRKNSSSSRCRDSISCIFCSRNLIQDYRCVLSVHYLWNEDSALPVAFCTPTARRMLFTKRFLSTVLSAQ
ncbi:hypothetical protein JZ751_009568 [Albula glossodonta]|uniref:Secreted protein n=1 Tax=Albula glossodonta TaxID=121402 RepID=A0A8T2P649_9TELE|nr:hypothetical protein JZ751_009568 [Albula glossodonta]